MVKGRPRGRRDGRWTPEEDAILKDFIEKNANIESWITLPGRAGLQRCGKSCRLRWVNYLKPGINHGSFTEEEEKTIIDLHGRVGSRWSLIADQLPGRTDNDIKNYWNSRLKKKLANKGKFSPLGYQQQRADVKMFHPDHLSQDAMIQWTQMSTYFSMYPPQTAQYVQQQNVVSGGMLHQGQHLQQWQQPKQQPDQQIAQHVRQQNVVSADMLHEGQHLQQIAMEKRRWTPNAPKPLPSRTDNGRESYWNSPLQKKHATKGIFGQLGHDLQRAYQSTILVPEHLSQEAVVRPTQMSSHHQAHDHKLFKYFEQQRQRNYATQQDAVSAAKFHQGQHSEQLQQPDQEPLVTGKNRSVNDLPPSDTALSRTGQHFEQSQQLEEAQRVSTVPMTEVPDETQTVRTLQSDPEDTVEWVSTLIVDPSDNGMHHQSPTLDCSDGKSDDLFGGQIDETPYKEPGCYLPPHIAPFLKKLDFYFKEQLYMLASREITTT